MYNYFKRNLMNKKPCMNIRKKDYYGYSILYFDFVSRIPCASFKVYF